jgi:aldose 1-epimerase
VISNLTLNNETVIKFPVSGDDPNKGFPSALLFPFPNRVRDGKYAFGDAEYQLERNETGRGHAVHGFVNDVPFEVVSERRNGISLMHHYEGEREGYPFPFDIEINYSIVRKQVFRLSYHIVNTGKTPMPCGFGWHPYFTLQESKVSEMSVSIPAHRTYEVDDSTIPFLSNDSAMPETTEATTFSLKNTILDNVYKIANGEKIASIILSNDKLNLTVSQQTGNELLNFFVLYTPPTRHSIAIEPQTCNINAFNNEDGLIVLQPEKSMKGQIDVALQRT